MRFRSRLGACPIGRVEGNGRGVRLGGQPLATAVAASSDDAAATLGSHAGTEAMPALADELGGLVGTLHLFKYRGVRPFLCLSLCNRSLLAGPCLARSKPRRVLGPERERGL